MYPEGAIISDVVSEHAQACSPQQKSSRPSASPCTTRKCSPVHHSISSRQQRILDPKCWPYWAWALFLCHTHGLHKWLAAHSILRLCMLILHRPHQQGRRTDLPGPCSNVLLLGKRPRNHSEPTAENVEDEAFSIGSQHVPSGSGGLLWVNKQCHA